MGGMFGRSNREGSISPDKIGRSPEESGSGQISNRERTRSPTKARTTKKKVNFSGFGMRGATNDFEDSDSKIVRPHQLFLT
jgi:hypothetical protein